ncbi:vanadium-dependent haloperoxidase [Hymenobacter volaticus]|uniref:Vanadium-dependent haloperoxidase n=1 Tax=Hymenobacter volaticus TaxID=2932254 RepID=A0ABY4GD12_9BACT|nr:vanadium-dependent haloperoxidase [Hymenobacter volaticus]UOQ68800.1 vanadium-dependent haloperoxidase [Hymenobacter volaticus]
MSIPPMAVPYSEDSTSSFYAAAHEVYRISKSLTPEQKAIANHWADVGGVGVGVPGPGHLISIVTGVLQSQRAKLGTAAVVYAKTGIANKDAFIIMWRGKFQYNLLRPVTYIQRHVEAGWLPYLVTPPYPEYPSGLAGIYTPVLQVLLREFGDVPVTDNAYAWNGSAPRHYASITAVMEEAAVSRVYGGIHYRFTQEATLALGRQVGNTIADIPLLPK